jgi:hypothetical protein
MTGILTFRNLDRLSRFIGRVRGTPHFLDLLLHHSTTVNIRGESYRLKERRKAVLIPPPEQQQAEPTVLTQRSRIKRDQLL